MNYLAHLYLSGSSEQRQVGNFIGDWVKGKHYTDFPDEIKEGILLHRAIDTFTDSHQSVHLCARLLYEKYHKYAKIVIDIFFDHFLAVNWNKYCATNLHTFVVQVYSTLIKFFKILPTQVQNIVPLLIANNRLESYSTIDGVKETLFLMSRYSSLPNESDFAINTLTSNYDYFAQQFNYFFENILQHLNFSQQITK